MKSVKNAISFVIFANDRTNILLVKRPPEDEDLPGVWGLPAGSLREGESFEEAVHRAGREKLGVQLQVLQRLNAGEIERSQYTLHMQLYIAAVLQGKPSVPQPAEGITQYVDLTWAPPEDLRPAAEKGSLCSRLALDALHSR